MATRLLILGDDTVGGEDKNSLEARLAVPGTAAAVARLLARTHAMGLSEERPDDLDVVFAALDEHGIARSAAARLRQLEVDGDTHGIVRLVERAADELEEIPCPETEWTRVGSLLGNELLEQLVGVASTSRRRYESMDRPTPDQVAVRLHFLAMVNADLLGSYNEFGVRRWYSRARERLEGRSPEQTLVGEWSPDDPGPRAVRELAAGLVALGAT